MTTTDSSSAPAGEGRAEGGIGDKPTVDLPADAANWIALIRDCDSKIKDLEEAKQLAQGHLKTMLGENELGLVDGREAVRWTIVNSTRLDTTKLKAERPEVYEAFTRPQMTRRFTLADPA